MSEVNAGVSVSTAQTQNATAWNDELVEPLLARDENDSSQEPQPVSLVLGEEEAVETTGQVEEGSNDELPCPSRLLFFKTLYFLNGLSGATWGRFGVIFYNQVKHLSAEQIGVLQGVMPLVGFLTMPFWGYIADMIQSRKAVYVFCKAMATVSLLLLAVVHGFYGIFSCVIGMATFRSSGVLDAHTLDFLGDKHRDLYGTIRLWCAVSWGLGCVVMGLVTDSFGFEWNFMLFAAMMVTVLLVTMAGLPARSKSEQARYDELNNLHSNYFK